MLTLAVVDDLATIVVIAVFFAADLSLVWIGVAVGLLALIVVARWAGIRSLAGYVVLAGAVWLAVFESGVHAAVAGVVLGFLTPAVASRGRRASAIATAAGSTDFTEISKDDPELSDAALMNVAHHALGAVSPLTRVEEAVTPYSAYLILPLFALANAGVPLSISGLADALTSQVGLDIFLGLVVGAPAGGMLLAYLSVRVGPGRMPENLDWAGIGGVAPLKGIGFTIAIFITTLTFDDRALEDAATLAVLAASLTAALIGVAVLLTRHALKTRRTADRTLSPST